MFLTRITGLIKNSGGVPLSGRLKVTLDFPLIDKNTIPHSTHTTETEVYEVTEGYVDFSLKTLFAVPTLALVAGLGLNWLVINWVDLSSSDWLALIVKSIAFCLGYLIVLAGIERKTLYRDVKQIFELIIRPDSETQSSLQSEQN